jgi:hypothetical protein
MNGGKTWKITKAEVKLWSIKLTPCDRIIFKKLRLAALVKKLQLLWYPRFITMFTRTYHWFLTRIG